jgi:hypothetical protein
MGFFSRRNLMAPDNFENLGLIFKEDQKKSSAPETQSAQGTETKN